MTCVFNTGATALGCYIIVTTSTSKILFDDIIHRNHDNLVVTKGYNGYGLDNLGIGMLRVIGYDYETDHTQGIIPVNGVVQRLTGESSSTMSEYTVVSLYR